MFTPFNALKTTQKYAITALGLLTVSAHANPESSVGVSSSEAYSFKSLYENFISMFDSFVTALAWVGAFIGIVMFIHGLYSIVQISNNKKQGSLAAAGVEIFISLMMLSVLFWTMAGVDFVQGFLK